MAGNMTARAYQEASARLRRAHDEEFHVLLAEVYEEWGLDVKKRRSRQQVKRDIVAQAQRIMRENV